MSVQESSATKRKIMVIGLDSAPLYLLDPWIKKGELPNIGRLMTEGTSGILKSTFPPLSPAAWSSFSTGMNPGKHGVYDHGYRQPNSYKIVPTNSLRRGGKTIWELISENGNKVGVINVPETYPPKPVNGFMITGMTTPSDESQWCYPETLSMELEEAIGGYQVHGSRSKENLDLSLEGMKQTIPMRVKAASYLWKQYQPDFMILVFMETDVVQHKTWKYMDHNHPQYDPIGAKRYGNAILDIYKTIDKQMQLLLNQIDEETIVIVMSDHGAGPIDKWINLNNWLLQNGFIKLKSAAITQLRHLGYRSGITPNNAYRIVSRLKTGFVDKVAENAKKQSSIRKANPLMNIFLSFEDIDWNSSRAYSIGGNIPGIWVNLRGREPEGCVSPGGEYEKLRDEIIERLETLRDPANGNRIATAIYRREEVYEGPYVDRAPDIVFETLNEEYVGFGIQEFVTNKIAEPSPLFSGCHREDGLFILHGKPIRRAVRTDAQQIIDLAPTILYFMNLDIPSDMDGHVIVNAITHKYLDNHPIKISGQSWKPSEDDIARFSSEEEAAVTERLRDLGYL